MKKYTPEIEFVSVSEKNYENVQNTLAELINKYENCIFDITGGEEVIIAAMGQLSFEKDIPMIRFDAEKGEYININMPHKAPKCHNITLTAEECLILNGAKKIKNMNNWEFNEDFNRDIQKMWSNCRVNCRVWNKQVTEFERSEGIREGKYNNFKKRKYPPYINTPLINKLTDDGLIYKVKREDDFLSLRFKNKQIKNVLTKAGNILELYVYGILCKINNEKEIYSDTDIGVYMDWDTGVYQNTENVYDTTNEADILLIKGYTPVFISCKNGELSKEALYELDTISKHFGGKYAKRVLAASYISADEEKKKYILRRAEDMNITVIYDIQDKSFDELIREFTEKI